MNCFDKVLTLVPGIPVGKVAHVIKTPGILLPDPFVGLDGPEFLISNRFKILLQFRQAKGAYVLYCGHAAKVLGIAVISIRQKPCAGSAKNCSFHQHIIPCISTFYH